MICLYLHFWVWDARMSLLLKQTRKRSTYCCVIYVSYKTNCLKSFLLPYCFCINGFLLLQQVKEGVMRGQRCKWKYYYKNTYIYHHHYSSQDTAHTLMAWHTTSLSTLPETKAFYVHASGAIASLERWPKVLKHMTSFWSQSRVTV